jgi:pimeloyl-ACP methyl ester carboxylesterase
MHLVTAGTGDPYVLIHGLGSEACVWEPVMDDLAERYHVIAVDLPGFGRSPQLEHGMKPTPAALAKAVAGLLDGLGLGTVHVAGNSLGGWIALELARAGRARTVVGLCPAGLWPAPSVPPGATPMRGRAHRIARRLRPAIPIALLSRRLRRAVLSPFVARPDAVPYHAARRMLSSYARASAYDATSWAMRTSSFTGAGDLRVPVTLAFGDRDRLIRPARLATGHARSVILRGCGHIPMWDNTSAVQQLLHEAAARG